MKFLFAIFFFSLTSFAQTDSLQFQNVSVISAEKLNIVYRGIDNPIRIIYPGAESISVAAPGIRKGIGDGNYILSPGPGNEVIIYVTAKMPDGTSKIEKKSFRILGLPAPESKIDGYDVTYETIKMTRQQLKEVKINIDWGDFLFPIKCDVWQFTLNLSKGKNLIVNSNTMNIEAKELIGRLKRGKSVVISDIKYWPSSVCMPKRVSPITIEIVD